MSRSASSERRSRRRSRLLLAGVFGFMTVLHLAVPKPFERLVPDWLPGSPALWNYAATAAEAASAALLARRDTARLGGMVAFATFAIVWIANLQSAIDGGTPGAPGWLGSPTAAWLRVPLQLPLLWWAWTHSRPD